MRQTLKGFQVLGEDQRTSAIVIDLLIAPPIALNRSRS
jgi:hypothetical protein